MSIFNLGKFLNTLVQMQVTIEAESSTSSDGGWKSPNTQSLNSKISKLRSNSSSLSVLNHSDGVLKTVDIAQEVIHQDLAGHALTGAVDLWHDGEVHRVLDPNLKTLQVILLEAFIRITNGKVANMSDYLVHVSDANANTSMVRPNGRGFSYLGSQMCIIDPKGQAHFLSMDRVRNTCGNGTSYIWRALSVNSDHELCIQHTDAGGSVISEPATSYAEVENLKIAIFTRPFCTSGLHQNSELRYAYRQTPVVKQVSSSVRTFHHRHELNTAK